MADNYQETKAETATQLQTNLVAPAAFVDSLIGNLPAGEVTITTLSPAQLAARAAALAAGGAAGANVTADIAGNDLAFVNYGDNAAYINLNALTPAQQAELAGVIFGPEQAGGAATGTFTVNYSNTSTDPAAAFHGSIMVGTGNNLLNINSAQAYSINAPNAEIAGELTQAGLNGTWNNLFNLSGKGDATVSLGSGDSYVSTGTGTNRINLLSDVLDGAQSNYQQIKGGAGADIVTTDIDYRGTASIDGGAGHNQLIIEGALDAGTFAKNLMVFTLQNQGVISVKNIQDFILGDAAGGPEPTIDFRKFTKDISFQTGAGNYDLSFGKGNDSVATGNGNDSVNTGNGNDSVEAGNGRNYILTSAGNDSVAVGAGNDYIDSGAGNDSVFTSGGSDSVKLGAGNDFISLETGFTGVLNVDGGKNTLDLSFVSVQSASQDGKNTPVMVTLSNGATIDATKIQQVMYSDADTGEVVTVGVAEFLDIFGNF